MNTIQNANQLSGRATGTLFFTGFGALWFLLALYAMQKLEVAAVSGVVLGTLVLLTASMMLYREAKRWPRVPDDPAMGRAFMWINAIQWIAISVVAFSFAKLHIDVYVMNAIAAIAGLHMFPLARLFRYSLHYVTGALLVGWAVASMLFAPAGQLQGIASFGTGAILWLSAATTLALTFQAARQSACAETAG
ncbi:MAG: hypothetical protein WA802_00170 [Terracidiphilus sp.]